MKFEIERYRTVHLNGLTNCLRYVSEILELLIDCDIPANLFMFVMKCMV